MAGASEDERITELESSLVDLRKELDRQRQLTAMKDLLMPQFLIVIDFDGPGRIGEHVRHRARPACMLCKAPIGVTDDVYAVRFRRFNEVGKGATGLEEVGHLHADCFGAATGRR